MPRSPNRLANEASPYLQQHANNPVDWYAWGEEALEKAKREDKPILLSIGYSACHWCHVMERESFEDEDIARQMNEGFVSIKVDREERPDLDQIYQLVVQMMGRSGGWPLTVFLTPDKLPFFGGTYFPPQDRYGMPGFPRVLASVLDAYKNRRGEIVAQAEEIKDGIVRAMAATGNKRESLSTDLLERASKKLFGRFDEQHGGFGKRPKFANTMCLDVLLRRASEEGDEGARARVVKALTAMRNGGIWDQLGYGFHRYSTDERWLVPHFEKMLYDNALLLRLYTDAFRATDIDSFARTASDIGQWMRSEMQSPGGGFYSTLDADSEGEEGKFYVFTIGQVEDALSGDEVAADVAKLRFGLTEAGNFENSGASVLYEAMPLSDIAAKLDRPLDEVKAALSRATQALLEARSKRPRPSRDEKLLASWNGLAIAALADASHALCEPALLEAAQKAFSHIERMLIDGGRVGRLIRNDIAKGRGFLDDHAFMAWAALELYEVTGQVRYLERAMAIADELLAHFWDEAEGAFFYTPHDGEELIVRARDPYDQSIPSGNAIAALVLSKLGAMVDERYAKKAEQQLENLSAAAMENPFAFGATIGGLDRLVRGSVDVVLFGSPEDPRAEELASVVLGHYLPNRNLVRVDPDDAASASVPKLLVADKTSHGGATAYVCRGRSCSAPIASASELAAELSAKPPAA